MLPVLCKSGIEVCLHVWCAFVQVAANSRSTFQRLSATASRAGDGFHRQVMGLYADTLPLACC